MACKGRLADGVFSAIFFSVPPAGGVSDGNWEYLYMRIQRTAQLYSVHTTVTVASYLPFMS
jgi:hypothetical protein